jgi:predicted dehydrogenase
MSTRRPKMNVSRRQFLTTSAAVAGGIATAGWLGPRRSFAATSPNEKANLAFVGVANKARHNLDQLLSENITAICDVDENYLNEVATLFPQAKKYRDYRQMLEKEAKNIDAVVVSTADHSHAPATSIALDLGKHVYCEKPLTHTVAEARAVAKLAKKNKLTTQMGTQIHAEPNYRRVVEMIQSGAIGKVKEVYNWCNKGWSDGRFATTETPVPSHLDWDLWLGPAKQRPYSPSIHPADWRRFWEYGSGTFGDMACHVMDLPFWALDLKYPTSVQCEGPEVHPDGAPAWAKAAYEFKLKDGSPLKFYWADGSGSYDIMKETKDHDGQPLTSWGLGILFVGDKGMLLADYGRMQLLPKDKFADHKAPEKSIPDSIGHWNEWLQGFKEGKPTTCNFDYSCALTETVLLGIVAYRSGQKFQWDSENLKSPTTNKIDEFVTKEYRKGFEVVGLKG